VGEIPIEDVVFRIRPKGDNMTGIIDFKTDQERAEYNDSQLDQKLKNIVTLLAYYSWEFFNKKVFITEVYRTQHENNLIYKDTKHVSLHTYHHAVDIRSSIYTDEEIEKLLTVANTILYRKGSKHKTAKYHHVGNGAFHFHIQTSAY